MPSKADALGPVAEARSARTPAQTAKKTWQAFRPTPGWFRAGAWVIHRLSWRLRLLEYALAGIEREATSTVRVPWRRKPWLWRHGFLSESDVLYGLRTRSHDDYLTDVERFVGSRTINIPYGILLDDKLLFDRLMEPFPDLKPRLFGVLDGPRILPAMGGEDSRSLRALLQSEKRLAVKPAVGGGGRGFALLEACEDGTFLRNGKPVEIGELERHGRAAERLMVTEHVEQHPEIAALYPHTVNTLRLLTMQDETGAPFIARAVIRIGCAHSVPTDNWIQGGICAEVDLESGTLGEAAGFPAGEDRMNWCARHPESGQAIAGAEIPQWDRVRQGILRVADTMPYLPYVGWDLVVTPEGFKIIEGNSYSGVNLFQIHGPLLRDPRVRAFFRRHRVVRR